MTAPSPAALRAARCSVPLPRRTLRLLRAVADLHRSAPVGPIGAARANGFDDDAVSLETAMDRTRENFIVALVEPSAHFLRCLAHSLSAESLEWSDMVGVGCDAHADALLAMAARVLAASKETV